jgi:hypothetical protein
VVREITGQEHRIGLRPDSADRLDRRREPGHGLVVEPLRSDVRIAELREEKRSGDDAASSPIRRPATKPQ